MRRIAAVGLLGLLLFLGGCLGGGVNQGALAQNETYDWNRSAEVSFNLTGGNVYAIHELSNTSEVTIFRDTEFQGEQPVSVSAVQFRYPNGTVVNATEITVEQSGGRTHITSPASDGKLAYTTNTLPKDFSIAVATSGSFEVILPPRMDIGVPVLGSISPGGAALSSTTADRTRLYWGALDSPRIELHFYLERDFWLFAGLVVTGVLAAIGGVVYYRAQIRRLRRHIEEAGLDIDQ